MAIEIERKFLVAHEGWRQHVTSAVRLRDVLIVSDGVTKVRVRIGDGSASLCLKGPKTSFSRHEFEYAIPLADAEFLLSTSPATLLEKTRHYVPFAGNMWEVDVYHGALEGLVLAEIELSAESQAFERPDWIGREVTFDAAYKKGQLLKSRWATLAVEGE